MASETVGMVAMDWLGAFIVPLCKGNVTSVNVLTQEELNK